MKKTHPLFKIALSIVSILTASTVSASDQALLDTLFENGVLNQAQYEKLSRQAEEKEQAEIAKTTSMSPTMAKAMDWASRIKVSGDMRFRHENIDTDTSGKGVEASHQLIRARIKVAAKINDEVDVGFRLVTGGSKTSGNQALEGSFSGKDVYFDRAYINWRPDFAKGTTAIFGKFKQPWYNVSPDGLIWDPDVNPEGVAVKYETKVGPVNLAASGGYFIIEDGDTLYGKDDNNGFSQDLNMYHAGMSVSMQITDAIKGSVGSNAYIYNKEEKNATLDSSVDGGLEAGETLEGESMEIYEVAGKLDIDTGLLPVFVYGQYATNASAKSGEDTAWLAGFGGKYGPFKMYYNYRDTQKYAVADTFNDGSFASGATAARGHKVGLKYRISKNFATGMAYYAAQEYNGTNIDTLELDLKAKF
ncbi:MAG: putative porin [Methylococcales bacterium]|nr:putative porin [Methylococcales bacterium]